MSGTLCDVRQSARDAHLDPALVVALVAQESSGDPWAYNPEPRYRYFWNVRTQSPFRRLTAEEIEREVPPVDFPTIAGDRDQEWWAQQASWGLLQIMGAVARETGFTGRYLTELCDPVLNLTLGCRLLHQLMLWAHGETWQAVAAYNGGRGGWQRAGPQRYTAEVRQRMVLV